MSMTVPLLMMAALAASPARVAIEEGARETTATARKLVLERIDAIVHCDQCRQAFGQEKIDLDRVRLTVSQLRFYNAEGPEGELRFSQVVDVPASPDERLRDLSRGLSADAFVLGYQQGRKYIRTKHVVLSRGYLWQASPQGGTGRPTTEEEKQALLLHEVLHVALDVDDDDLTRRELCPLRLLLFCPRTPAKGGAASEYVIRRPALFFSGGDMKAIAVFAGQPGSVHLAEISRPSIAKSPTDGRSSCCASA